MKIGQQPDIKPVSTQPVAPTSGPQVGQAASSSGAVRGERKAPVSSGVGVTVSESARTLEAAAADSGAEVDTEKVNAMRQAIENNTFLVNPEAIADKLLANAREMLQRTDS